MLEFPASIAPQLSPAFQACIRIAYGLLLLGTLLAAIPHARRFFLSERWGGYAKSSVDVDLVQNPILLPIIFVVWLSCAVMLVCDRFTVAASLLNLGLCRYFFVHMRWRGLLRGMGAPGFMTYWLAFVVFLLEATRWYAPNVQPFAVFVCQVDFALIMLSAGIYKLSAGYARNQGMELGMVNPQWGYWARFYARMKPGHWIFWVCNQLGWSVEIIAAILMLIPATRIYGAILIFLSFVFIATQIRLCLLTEMVMLGCFLFLSNDMLLSLPVDLHLSLLNPGLETAGPSSVPWSILLSGLLWSYLILLPLAHAGLFYNFYGKRSLPRLLQRVLESYTNFFGIIIWRVFSVDLINFTVRIYNQSRSNPSDRSPLTHFEHPFSRFNHVAESITLTCLFTALKYYASNKALFHERLLRYAKTLPCPPDRLLVFEYISIRKERSQFAFVPACEFFVDPVNETIAECVKDPGISLHRAAAVSPLHEGARPGSYVPLGA
jgi:hypothetical protein